MDLDTLRRRRVPLGLGLLLFALWLGTGIRRTAHDGPAVVRDSPLGLLAPRPIEPGWHLAPPGLVRLSAYPATAATYSFRIGDSDSVLASRDGIRIVAEGAIRYRVDPDRLIDVHRTLGPRLERQFVQPWVERDLIAIAGAADYTAISGARTDDLRIELGKLLAERFRVRGLVLLSCEIDAVRIRVDAADAPVRVRRVPGMKVLIIGLDGADWNILEPLVDAGHLPNLARLSREGTRGRLRSITPMLSPVIWTSIATGVGPGRHGIVDFVATTGREGEQVPVTSSLRKVKAFWNILSENGLRVGIVGWWASFPAEKVDGFIVSDRVAYQLFRAPPLGTLALRGKVFPPEADELVSSLTVHPETYGPADLARYVRGAGDPAPIPDEDQQRIESLKTLLAAGDTYASLTTALAERYQPDLAAFYLEGTDTVAHLFMPFASPPMKGIGADSRRRFVNTVDAYYRHADRIVGRIIASVKPEVTIVLSDHGFRTGDNRPSSDSRIGYGPAADWHRKYGVVILSGPPFRVNHELEEASVLDVTPTVLALFGLPVAEDMDGRPWVDAFRPEFLAEHPIRYVPSYEGEVIVRFDADPPAVTGAGQDEAGGAEPVAPATDGSESRAPAPEEPPPVSDPAADAALMERLRSLGYLRQDSSGSHNNRGLLLLERGEFDAAIGEFEQAVAGAESSGFARFNLARAYYKKNDYQAATRVLHELLDQHADSKQAENLLGNIAMERGRLEIAERHFRRAVTIEPNYTDGRNSLGILYDRMGRHPEALGEFRRVVAVDPDYGEAYNNIGLIHQREGRIDESIAEFRQAIRADPAFAGAYSNLAVALEQAGDLDAAEQQFREALRRDPDNVKVRANYGGLLYKQGRLQEARAELQAAIEDDPSDPSAHNNLGAVYGRLGRAADAIAAYRRAIALDPDYADAGHNLALALLGQGSSGEAEALLRRTIEIRPEYVPACTTLARHMLESARLDEGVDLLQRCSAAASRSAEVWMLLGEALLRQGATERAIAALEAALEIDPQQTELRQRIESLRGLAAPEGTGPDPGSSGIDQSP